MTSEIILGEAGTRGGHYEVLFHVVGTGTGEYEIFCGFKPSKIIITQTGNTQGATQMLPYMFIYDEDYSTTNVRYAAGQYVYEWTDYAMSGAGSTVRRVTNTGFVWHQNAGYDTARLDIIAIK